MTLGMYISSVVVRMWERLAENFHQVHDSDLSIQLLYRSIYNIESKGNGWNLLLG
jgi:hypothetical protein